MPSHSNYQIQIATFLSLWAIFFSFFFLTQHSVNANMTFSMQRRATIACVLINKKFVLFSPWAVQTRSNKQPECGQCWPGTSIAVPKLISLVSQLSSWIPHGGSQSGPGRLLQTRKYQCSSQRRQEIYVLLHRTEPLHAACILIELSKCDANKVSLSIWTASWFNSYVFPVTDCILNTDLGTVSEQANQESLSSLDFSYAGHLCSQFLIWK